MKKRTRRAGLVAAAAVVAAGALVAATSAFGDVAHRSDEPGDFADRVFDQSKRLLGDLRPPSTRSKLPDEIRLPDPMPDFAGEGIAPANADGNAAQLDRLSRPALRLPRHGEAQVSARLAVLVAAESRRVPT